MRKAIRKGIVNLIIFISSKLSNIYFKYEYNLRKNTLFIGKDNNYKYNSNITRINKRILNELNEKCTKIDYQNLLCFECNIKGGYYPIYYDYNYDIRKNILKKYIKQYIDCYNENTKPIGYYLNIHIQAYEKCYESCKSCFGNGNRIYHNCSTCIDNYIFQPEIPFTTNCVPICKYYYYYSFIGNYECTENYHCPYKINLLVEKEKKCLSDCNYDNIYIYQYNGECLEQCPYNTNNNSLNICLDSNIQQCTITIKNSSMSGKSLNNAIIDEMVKTFAQEFSYTQNHISQFKIDNYSIIFVKNISCLKEFQLSFSHIDFKETYDKIISYFNFTTFPILAIIDNIDFMNNFITKYAFYDPINGSKLNTSFWANSSIVIKKNISIILENGNFDWLIEQNIDIFNITSEFYSNMCFHFRSHNGKDVILKDRILNYFPNISLCDEGCESQGINYYSKIVICQCNFTYYLTYFTEMTEEIILFYNEVIKFIIDIYNIYENKFTLLFCYYKLFYYENYFKNTGGIILIILILVQIACTILFIIEGFDNINKYIFYVSESYIKLTNRNKNNINSLNSSVKEIFLLSNELSKLKNILQTNTFPNVTAIKKSIDNDNEDAKSIKFPNIQDNVSLNTINNKNGNNITNSISKQESLNITDDIISIKYDNNNNNSFSAKVSANSNILIDIDKNLEKEMLTYVNKSPDEMEFYEIKKYDKRNLFEFYFDKIKINQILIKTFCFKEETIPKKLKIILFIIYIDLVFICNVYFFDNEYISKLFYTNENFNFFGHMEESLSHIATYTILITFIEYFMELFFFYKKYIKCILIQIL